MLFFFRSFGIQKNPTSLLSSVLLTSLGSLGLLTENSASSNGSLGTWTIPEILLSFLPLVVVFLCLFVGVCFLFFLFCLDFFGCSVRSLSTCLLCFCLLCACVFTGRKSGFLGEQLKANKMTRFKLPLGLTFEVFFWGFNGGKVDANWISPFTQDASHKGLQ